MTHLHKLATLARRLLRHVLSLSKRRRPPPRVVGLREAPRNPVFEALREAMLRLGEQLRAALFPVIEAIIEWWVAVKREALYRRLRRWRFPHRLARFLAMHWPRRWLPGLESVD